MDKLLIIGASGHGKVIAEIAELSNQWEEVCFIDDDPSRSMGEYKIVGSSQDLVSLVSEYSNAFVAIGNNRIRMNFLDKLVKVGYETPTLVHPKSIISSSVRIGYGTVVMAGAVINPDCKIGNGCIINTGCTIDHDCQLQDGVHVSPGAHIAGTVTIGRNTWICIGTNVANNVSIGANTVIAAGSTVLKDIPDNVMVAGTPCTIRKQLTKLF